jgi:hypothetical protein
MRWKDSSWTQWWHAPPKISIYFLCWGLRDQFHTHGNINTEYTLFNFHIHTAHLDIIKVFLFTNEAQVIVLKNNIKIYIKTAQTHFGAVTPSSGSALSVLCRSYFNVNFNIVFQDNHLCIRWWIKNFDRIQTFTEVCCHTKLKCYTNFPNFLGKIHPNI